MKTVRVVFSRSRTIGSVVIRFLTWSSWAHNAIETPDGTVIEARWPEGVVETPVSVFRKIASKRATVDIDCPDPAAAIAWARSQIGKPYDVWGVVGLGFRRRWQDDDAWWCSELVETALEHGGRQRFRHDLQRVTPQHSWMVT